LLSVSDHGESLGGNGLNLRVAPRVMAPWEQTWVPMVMWLDQAFPSAMNIDEGGLRRVAGQP
jgi:lipid A ethanolaminephosphotransferase